jgi:hypothetical protein
MISTQQLLNRYFGVVQLLLHLEVISALLRVHLFKSCLLLVQNCFELVIIMAENTFEYPNHKVQHFQFRFVILN